MKRRTVLAALCGLATALAASAVAAGASAACKLSLIGAPVPITFDHNRPVIAAFIDGKPVRALVDTGASISLLFRGSATRMGLRLDTVSGLRMYGAGGATSVQAATIDLRIAGAERRGMRIVVAGERPMDVDMLLGQDILQQADVEYDFANHTLRLLDAQNCADSDMPYWASRYDEAALLPAGAQDEHLIVDVKLNGHATRAILDTGAAISVASPALAAAAGVPLRDAGAMSGLGSAAVAVKLGVVKRLQVGGEVIPDATLAFGDLFGRATYGETGSLLPQKEDAPADMLLGSDFFAAHRVLVSPSHRKMFFSYNGGPAFPGPGGPAPAK
ncbi:MAG: aspartyl protease family protein [Caulobacteraceae bacterium]|nr:aspartyl protease family protein [Caulobacter sp.]